MTRLISLALQDFKGLLKYKKAYLILLLMPILLILILGNVFNNDSEFKVDKFDISLCNEDVAVVSNGIEVSLGDIFDKMVLESDNIKSMINVTVVSNADEGKKLVNDGKSAAFIYIPGDFTESYYADGSSKISLIGDERQSIRVDIVRNIIDIFSDRLRTAKIDGKISNELSIKNNLSTESMYDIAQYISRFDTNVADNYIADNYINTEENDTQKPVSAMQYYAIAMIVMFAMFTSFTLIHSMADEKRDKIFFRIQTTPIKGLEYAVGKLVGIVFTLTVQMSVLIVATTLLYGMKWGNIYHLFIVLIAYSFAIGTITLLAGLIAKDYSVLSNLSMPVVFVLSFLGGSFVRKEELPASLDFAQKLVPNGQALNAFLKVVLNRDFSEIFSNLTTLIITGLVFLCISLLFFRGMGLNRIGIFGNSQKSDKASF